MHATIDSGQLVDDHTCSDDTALARQALEDPTAFAELYERYRVRIYWYLRARAPSEDDAADLTQQVFVAAFDRLRQYRERKGSFATWLFTIARNAATDFHRRRRSMTAWDSLPATLHPMDDRDLATDVERHEAILRVHELVAMLPPEKRELLVLRYAADLTIPEMAAVIGKSPHATRKQLTRLLQSLEDHYHDPRIGL
jgi:RNA polymerase sigma-70 factor (ECF subfamily)